MTANLTRQGETAMLRSFVRDTSGNPDAPVPFTLTPKAHAFLDRTARAMHASPGRPSSTARCTSKRP